MSDEENDRCVFHAEDAGDGRANVEGDVFGERCRRWVEIFSVSGVRKRRVVDISGVARGRVRGKDETGVDERESTSGETRDEFRHESIDERRERF